MAKDKVCEGKRLDYTNSSGSTIAAGSAVLVGALLGVALTDIPDDETGVLDLEGVYELPKAKDEAMVTLGSNLYYDTDGQPQGGLTGQGCLTATAQGNVYAGKQFSVAGSTDLTVQIKLNV